MVLSVRKGVQHLEMESKKKWPDKRPYKWMQHIVLTKPEGVIFDAILAQFECSNASKLCKRIVRGELELKLKSGAD